jgi:hypothetical protein
MADIVKQIKEQEDGAKWMNTTDQETSLTVPV